MTKSGDLLGVYSKFFRYFEHIFPGFFVIVTDNSIQYRLFNCIFDIPDSFTGRQMESGDDFFTADGGLEIPDRIFFFHLFEFAAYRLEIFEKTLYFLFVF